MFRRIRLLLEMIRFSHTIFALPFAMLAAVMAWTTPTAEQQMIAFQPLAIVGILVCMVTARSAAMAFNRIADRGIDAANPRTQNRHLPAGLLSLGSVVVFMLVNCVVFVAATLLFLPNRLPIYLSVPVLLVLFTYSFTKRWTSLAHFWLGMSLMLAPVSTWIALRGEEIVQHPVDLLPPVLLGLGVLLWVAGFDIIYACQDTAFDQDAKLKSVPAKVGVANALRIAAVCHVAMVAVFVALPILCPQVPWGAIYWTGVGAVAILVAYEHAIVRPDDLTKVNIAFFNVNAIISIGLFVVGTVDSLL